MKALTTVLFVSLSALILLVHVGASAVTPFYSTPEKNDPDNLYPEKDLREALPKEKAKKQDSSPFIAEDSGKSYPRPSLGTSGRLQLGLGFLLLSVARISRYRIKKEM